MNKRIEPFLDLLDARYLPLLFAYAPQAYTVYAWQLASGAPHEIALLAGIGFEFISVGAIAWSERGAGWEAARYPSIMALLFSVGVAVAHYGGTEGALAVLHAGFPLVAYAYTRMMHSKPVDSPMVASLQAQLAETQHALTLSEQRYTVAIQIVNQLPPGVAGVDTKREQVKALVDSGVSVSSAARQAGVARSTAHKYVGKKG